MDRDLSEEERNLISFSCEFRNCGSSRYVGLASSNKPGLVCINSLHTEKMVKHSNEVIMTKIMQSYV